MMHRRCREPTEAEHAPHVVAVDETPERVAFQQRLGVCRRDPERLAQLIGANGHPFGKLAVQARATLCCSGEKGRK
jgi:hypothetical protein